MINRVLRHSLTSLLLVVLMLASCRSSGEFSSEPEQFG